MGSSGDRGPCHLHAHSTAHCGAASLAFIGPNHACRSHRESLSPNNNTPVKTGVLWGSIYGVGDGLVLQACAPVVEYLQQILNVDVAVAVDITAAWCRAGGVGRARFGGECSAHFRALGFRDREAQAVIAACAGFCNVESHRAC